jgi:hypothetical protein
MAAPSGSSARDAGIPPRSATRALHVAGTEYLRRVMVLQCASCSHQLLAGQARCPECGCEGPPLTAIAAGRPEDLTWHRGWTSFGCGLAICIVLAIAGLSTITTGKASVGIPCGLPLLLLGSLGFLAFVRGAVRRVSGVDARPVRAAFDDEFLYAGSRAYALAAIEDVRVEETRRADRWRLVVTLRPIAATFPADEIERQSERSRFISLFDAGGFVDAYIAAPAEEARVFADGLEMEIRTARRARIDVDDELVGRLLDPEGTGVPSVRDRAGLEALGIDAESLVVTNRRRRLIPWSRVADLDLGVDHPARTDGDPPLWRWILLIRQAPRFVAGLQIDRRSVLVHFAHEDPRAGAALWSVLERARPDS